VNEAAAFEHVPKCGPRSWRTKVQAALRPEEVGDRSELVFQRHARGDVCSIRQRPLQPATEDDSAPFRRDREGFYVRLGWERWRGPLFIRTNVGLDPTPEESVMILRLAGTPTDLDLNEPLCAEWRAGELW
jgi:hypothetical protein